MLEERGEEGREEVRREGGRERRDLFYGIIKCCLIPSFLWMEQMDGSNERMSWRICFFDIYTHTFLYLFIYLL
jgi:hypothetical protein